MWEKYTCNPSSKLTQKFLPHQNFKLNTESGIEPLRSGSNSTKAEFQFWTSLDLRITGIMEELCAQETVADPTPASI
jgi:hypothetical protein